jgi:short-subunit dehydrogenase
MNVVITGASSGIGRALAAAFARKGHSVLAIARREDRLRALARELAEVPQAAPVAWLALDITAPGAPQAVLDEAVRVFGKVHVLINDAGMSPYQEFRDLSHAHLRRTIQLNVLALTELCHFFLPHMLAHGEPCRLVNVGSVGSYAPLPKFSVYTGSKHYVRVFTNLLRREYRGTNIRVSGLYPGGTLTEFPALAGQKPKPIARAGMHTPEQVAAIAYPAILAGRRVIIPGFMNQAAAFAGKVLPYPLAVRLMEFIYDLSVEQVETTYPE